MENNRRAHEARPARRGRSPRSRSTRRLAAESAARGAGACVFDDDDRRETAGIPVIPGDDRRIREVYYRRVTRAPIHVALVLAACRTTTPPGLSSGPGITSVSETTSGSSTGSDSSSTGPEDDSAGSVGSTAGASTGILRDVGAATDFDPGKPEGCKGKVDLLFLISRETRMQYAQEQLIASFPGFVKTIAERLEGFDVHIMAANPDGEWTGFVCQTEKLCGTHWPDCFEDGDNWDCMSSVQEWQPCDSKLGAGVTFNAGPGTANKRCDLYDGNNYIVSGEPDPSVQFGCIAAAGIAGPLPATGDALIAAVSPELNKEGACNAGFLREDALLVVVIIDNAYDGESVSSPKTQYDAVIAAKKDPQAVVMLAITAFPPKEGEPLDPNCIYDDGNANNYLPLLEQFPYHRREDACADSYVSFFEDSVAMIDEACGLFVPQ
jgi:hypothetical protein